MSKKSVPPIFVKTGAPRKKRLLLAAKLTERDMSDISREAIDEKLDALSREIPALRRENFEPARAA